MIIGYPCRNLIFDHLIHIKIIRKIITACIDTDMFRGPPGLHGLNCWQHVLPDIRADDFFTLEIQPYTKIRHLRIQVCIDLVVDILCFVQEFVCIFCARHEIDPVRKPVFCSLVDMRDEFRIHDNILVFCRLCQFQDNAITIPGRDKIINTVFRLILG